MHNQLMPSRTVILLLGLLFALTSISAQDKAKLKALIIDGQNNHDLDDHLALSSYFTLPVLR